MRTTLVSFFLLVLVLAGCSAPVAVQQKPGVDFSQYRTYDWAKTEVKSAKDILDKFPVEKQ